MQIRSKFWFADDEGKAVFGEGRKRMLELIEKLGSMQASAKELEMSYRGVWARIKATESRLNVKLIETSVGRGKEHGSRLTPEAKELLANYKLIAEKGNAFVDELFAAIQQGRSPDIAQVVPAVAVVGPPRSGKSRLIECLVEILAERGRPVGVIKVKSPAEQLQKTAGQCYIEAEGASLAIHLPHETAPTPEAIAANYCLGCDLALVESEERQHLPSIELFRREISDRPITKKKKHILAVVGDTLENAPDRPHFSPDDVSGLADLLESQIISAESKDTVKLLVNGKRVPMLPFVQDIFERAVAGMVSSLKAVEDNRNIDLIIRRRTAAGNNEQ